MNIPAHLAQQILETNFENICAKLKAGGTLTTAEANMMGKLAGRAPAAAPPPIAASTTTLPLPQDPAPAAPDPAPEPFSLEPPPHHLSAEQLARWAAMFGTAHRQLRRWHRHGQDRRDPCPLDRPADMPAWWRRNMKHVVPPKILLAAEAARVAACEGVDGQLSAENRQGVGANAVPLVPATLGTFDLNAASYTEGEAVRQARQIVGANYSKLTDAYAANPPDLDGIQLWQVRWEKSVEALRKQERDDREAQKSRGQLVSRCIVESEVAQMLEALRLMHGAMTQKILASLSTHATGRLRRLLRLLNAPLRAAVESVRAKEIDVLRNLQNLTSAEAAASAASREVLTLAA